MSVPAHRTAVSPDRTGPARPVQAVLSILLAGSLAGCSSVPDSVNPVTWWHDLQGGAIAEQRPPPPGADKPYPNLADVPQKPPSLDAAAQQKIDQGLIADRANAHYAATLAPLPDPSSRAASPGLFGKGTLPPPVPPPAPGGLSASLAAAGPNTPAPAPASAGPTAGPSGAPAQPPAQQPPPQQPPAPTATPATAPPRTAPVAAVSQAPLAPPAAPTEQQAEKQVGPLPSVPAAPPAPPNLPGVKQVTAPAPSPPAPPEKPKPQPLPDVAPAEIAFPVGSAILSPESARALKQFATKRAGFAIRVTGFGEATGDSPAAQSAGVALGLARAQAMAASLAADGVPAASLHVDAVAAGHGGIARLVN
jgi:outer membrane protein OmpA-like peptidoglycan-associated protein